MQLSYVSQIAANARLAVAAILDVQIQRLTSMLRSIFLLRLLKRRWTAAKE
jgi:hypothetical protein